VEPEHVPAKGLGRLGIALASAGVAASAYLLARTFALLTPARHPVLDVCSALFSTSCDGTLADPRSWVLGIPLAGWGLVYFATVAAALALARFVAGAFERPALIAASALALAGGVLGVALTLGAWWGGEPICPMCVSIHALSLGLCFVLQRAIGQPLRSQVALVRAALAGLFRSGAVPESARWQFVGIGCVALVTAMSYQWVYVESSLRRPAVAPPADPGKTIAAYTATPEQELPVSESDPHHGPLDAPVRLVVFESFQCPHCQRFAATLPRLEREFRERLLVVFKHYPLSTRCNDRMREDLQPDACEIAWAAEAARQQARFWPFHDAMLAASQRPDAGAIERAARGAGVELARFEADRRSAAVHDHVAEDIALGNRLRLPGTPAVYLDGRLVRPASAEVLEILVRHELERRAARALAPGRAARPTGPPAAARRPTMAG
jgi:protein-disulfide isomerase/uncharacterized membrane protein